jgi:hypothetical protein
MMGSIEYSKKSAGKNKEPNKTASWVLKKISKRYV